MKNKIVFNKPAYGQHMLGALWAPQRPFGRILRIFWRNHTHTLRLLYIFRDLFFIFKCVEILVVGNIFVRPIDCLTNRSSSHSQDGKIGDQGPADRLQVLRPAASPWTLHFMMRWTDNFVFCFFQDPLTWRFSSFFGSKSELLRVQNVV